MQGVGIRVMVARIAVSAATYHIDKPYDYIVPENLASRVMPGVRVLVPFGKGDRKSEGVVLSLKADSSYKNLKEIIELLDDVPVINDYYVKLALWMSDRFFCTVFDAFRVMLPSGMWTKDGVTRVSDKLGKMVTLTITAEEAIKIADSRQTRAPKQAAIIRLLAETSSVSLKDICYITQASPASVKALEKQSILSLNDYTILRKPVISTLKGPDLIVLNEEQQQAYNSLAPLLKSNKPEAALLYGVTGSGKTLVYIKLIEEVTALGKTAIVLVPEISLTPQVVGLFSSYFGESVAVLHSSLGTGERYDEWKRIRSGTVHVVVGTRSAIFAPLENLGLIVIDEEQEHTYKSDSSPRYHARDIAKYRVTHANALLLLSSATPSIESMYNAIGEKYKLLQINKRYNDKHLPSVIIADMRNELRNNNGSPISSILQNELRANIERDEQSILFINRRGANPLVSCGECGYTFSCTRCSVSMTYHSSNKRLVCHYCGYSLPIPSGCPECNGKLRFIGTGTQKVETELHTLFPGISIIRMDADTVGRKNSHDKLLSHFRNRGASILLGTQMVTKGLDFDNVTLVGVISADSMLYMGDFRAQERAFSLITQVVGRSGRGIKDGRAVIQTFSPEHDVILLAAKQDYVAFYEREIALRETLGSPPAHDLFSVTVSGIDESSVTLASAMLGATLGNYFSGDKMVKLLGPAPAPISKIKNTHRYRILISCDNTKAVRDTIAHTIREFSREKAGRGITVYADSDPL